MFISDIDFAVKQSGFISFTHTTVEDYGYNTSATFTVKVP